MMNSPRLMRGELLLAAALLEETATILASCAEAMPDASKGSKNAARVIEALTAIEAALASVDDSFARLFFVYLRCIVI